MVRSQRHLLEIQGRDSSGHSSENGGPAPELALPAGAASYSSFGDGYYNLNDTLYTLEDFFVPDDNYGAWVPSQEDIETEGGFGNWWTDTVKFSTLLRDEIKNAGAGSTIVFDITCDSGFPGLSLWWYDQATWTYRLEMSALGDQGGTAGSVTSIQNYEATPNFAGDTNYRNRINAAPGVSKVGFTVTPTMQSICVDGEDAFSRNTTVTFNHFNDFILYMGNGGSLTITNMTIYPPKTNLELKALVTPAP